MGMAVVELPHDVPSHVPRRDGEARAALVDAGRRVAPVSAARERMLAVPGSLGALLPGGGLRRGSVTRVHGAAGSGVTSVALRLLAAATAAGEWAAAVDAGGSLGGLAAVEAGVVPERFALVRGVTRDRWSTVTGALLEGVTLVTAEVPVGLRAGDARRLVARARERGALLVVVEPTPGRGAWPADAVLHLEVTGTSWGGSFANGLLGEPTIHVEVTGKGAAHRPRRAGLRDAV
jgi:hypothetical protein